MRKHMIALLGFLSGAAVYYLKAPAPAPVTMDEFHQEEFVSTTLAAVKKENRTPAVIPVAEPPADISQEETRNLEGLPRGMRLAPFIRAVPKENYHADFGPRLLEKNGFVFYRSEAPGNANVVYDKRLNTFHPLTATIKLTGVTEEIREEVLRSWSEYHFNPELGVQYVQSSHAGLLSDFEELKKAGFSPAFEVIQAVYQTR